MFDICISGSESYFTDEIKQKLLELGFSFTNTKRAWLKFCDFSSDINNESEVKKYSKLVTNIVGFFLPEQSAKASKAMHFGMQDYLLLPLDNNQLVSMLVRLKELSVADDNFIVASKEGRQLLMLAHRAATTNASVLLCGESGTGKEPLARYIHNHSARRDKPFIAVNCAAIPEHILESMLFGHKKGSFTGATNDQIGKFELANGGTLLLDEISELPLMLQAKLLRVIQERELEKIGSHKVISLDIRIIAATNKDLRKAVVSGEFRADLFYRLDVLPIQIKPLKERRDDIIPLAEHFIAMYQTVADSTLCTLSRQAIQVLMNYEWPGNVRELENTIQRALILRHGNIIQAEDLGLPISIEFVDIGSTSLKESKRQAEYHHIIDVLSKFNGNRTKSAEFLSITTRALRYRLNQMRNDGFDINKLVMQESHAA